MKKILSLVLILMLALIPMAVADEFNPADYPVAICMAVSYTHLDVYKRQCNSFGRKAINFQKVNHNTPEYFFEIGMIKA